MIKLIRLLRSSCELNCRASLVSFYLVINSVIFSSVPAKNAKKTIQQIPVLQLPVHLLVTTAISFRLPLSIDNISQRPHHLLIHYSYVNCLAFLVKHFPNVIPKRASENQPPPSVESAYSKCWTCPSLSTATAAATSGISTKAAFWSGPPALLSTTRANSPTATARSARLGFCCGLRVVLV